ncbi:MAG: serine/threonine protein kinase [Deltaproteobacteria bacterium]|nr:serine/threonine protein kinase [Deltaproteobacteria bacterium]
MASEARAQSSYRVTERLESGGMAEVFRGEATSVAGFKKQVAIKRVLPHLASNEKFIRMFLDEARLSARLSHANIVQVFDIGRVENTYFIVMEFIDGVNLKHLIENLRNKRQAFPMALACHIAIKVCEGLQYAHHLHDSDNQDLHIVHRDISPPNVLISRQGEVKIVDFGLAKAAHSVEKTEPGVVKGKFSYLAPETAMGQEADAQADIFAVGIMLWEMLAGRKLFQGETDYQTVKMVQQAVVPSLRSINPAVPEELENILAVALAKDKRVRYADAAAFSDELLNFIFGNKMRVGAQDLARVVNEAVAERKGAATLTRKDGSVIDQLIQEELLRFTSLDDPHSPSPAAKTGTAGSNPNAEGARPLDAGDFENVGEWASDLLDDGRPSRAGIAWESPLDGVSASVSTPPGNLADELEGDAPDSPVSDRPPTPKPPLTQPTSLVRSQSYAPLGQPPPTTTEGKRFPAALLAVVAALLLVGVGVGLYVKGVFPH